MDEIKKEKILKFIDENKPKRLNVFKDWEEEILFMRERGTTYNIILEYIFTQDENIKLKYKNNIATAINMISRMTKKNQSAPGVISKIKEA